MEAGVLILVLFASYFAPGKNPQVIEDKKIICNSRTSVVEGGLGNVPGISSHLFYSQRNPSVFNV